MLYAQGECANLWEEAGVKGEDQGVCLVMPCLVPLRQAPWSWVRLPSIHSSLPISAPSVVLWFWVCLAFSDGCWGFEPRSLCLLSKSPYVSHCLSQLLLCFFLKVIHTIIWDFILTWILVIYLPFRLYISRGQELRFLYGRCLSNAKCKVSNINKMFSRYLLQASRTRQRLIFLQFFINSNEMQIKVKK